jgi:hypothetical protein
MATFVVRATRLCGAEVGLLLGKQGAHPCLGSWPAVEVRLGFQHAERHVGVGEDELGLGGQRGVDRWVRMAVGPTSTVAGGVDRTFRVRVHCQGQLDEIAHCLGQAPVGQLIARPAALRHRDHKTAAAQAREVVGQVGAGDPSASARSAG